MTVETQEIIIPSSEADRQKLRQAFEQISAAWDRAAAERDYISQTLKDLAENFGIPKKELRKWAKTFHKNAFEDEANGAEALEAARILIFKQGDADVSNAGYSDDE